MATENRGARAAASVHQTRLAAAAERGASLLEENVTGMLSVINSEAVNVDDLVPEGKARWRVDDRPIREPSKGLRGGRGRHGQGEGEAGGFRNRNRDSFRGRGRGRDERGFRGSSRGGGDRGRGGDRNMRGTSRGGGNRGGFRSDNRGGDGEFRQGHRRSFGGDRKPWQQNAPSEEEREAQRQREVILQQQRKEQQTAAFVENMEKQLLESRRQVIGLVRTGYAGSGLQTQEDPAESLESARRRQVLVRQEQERMNRAVDCHVEDFPQDHSMLRFAQMIKRSCIPVKMRGDFVRSMRVRLYGDEGQELVSSKWKSVLIDPESLDFLVDPERAKLPNTPPVPARLTE